MRETTVPFWLALTLFLSASCSECIGETGISVVSCDPVSWQGDPSPEAADYAPVCGKARKALRLKTPGEVTARLQLDLEKCDKIAVRLAAGQKGRVGVRFKSGEGAYFRESEVLAGEQVVLLPTGVFERQGAAGGWDAVEAVSIVLPEATGASDVLLLAVEALPAGVAVTGDDLFLVRPSIPLVRPIGMAWPIYAILSETQYPARAEPSPQVLQGLLEEMFGLKLPINPPGVAAANGMANVAFLGKEAALKAGRATPQELAAQGYSGFVLHADNGAVTIAGENYHGTAYGTYRFLEKQGCRFYAYGCRKVPKKAQRAMEIWETADRPFFEGFRFGDFYWNYGQASTMSGAPAHAETPQDFESLFDKDLSWGWGEHTAGYLVPKKLYYRDHPEYFALRGDGLRIPDDTQDFRLTICTTHPEVLKISTERALRWIGLQSDRKYFSITQGDDHAWCRCPTCLAMDYEPENHSDRMLYWVNAVAREVARKYPDKVLITYAYGPTERPPLKLKPEKNVHVQYCAWPNKTSCPCGIRDFDAPENAVARSHILGWLKVAPGQIGLYDYNSGGRYTLYGMAWKVKWCAKRGMVGFHYCGGNKSFEYLFRYVHSHLNWDPFLEVNRLKNEFIDGFYGSAGPVVRELFDMIYDRVEYGDYDAEMGAGGFPPARFFARDFVERAFALFDKALELTAQNPMANSDLVQTKQLFIRNCFSVRPGLAGKLTDDQYYVFGRNLRAYVEWSCPLEHQERVENARKQKKEPPPFSYKPIADLVWELAYVRIPLGEDPSKMPPLLAELLADPKAVVEKHRKTYFVEKTADGLRVPPIQFTGGQYWANYNWKCPGKDGAIVRGTMTEFSRMKAEFVLDELPERPAVLEIEGQDSDKEWCAPAPIQVFVNSKKVFEGPNSCVKQGWSRRSLPLPVGTLQKGANTIEFRNLYNSDSLYSHWFMVSEVLIRFPDK